MKKVIIAAVATAIAGLATASPFDIKFTGTGAGAGANITWFGNVMNVFAGKLNFVKNPSGPAFTTVCADLGHYISGGQVYNVDLQFSSAAPANVALAGRIVAANFASATSNEQAAALQLAVWEALYDGASTPSFGGGNFCTNGSTHNYDNLATQYYLNCPTNGEALYYKTTGNTGQSQLGVVPEPAALTALLAGMGVLAMRRKRA